MVLDVTIITVDVRFITLLNNNNYSMNLHPPLTEIPYVSKNFWSSRSCKTKALKTYGAACQIIIELSETSLIAVIILFAKCYL
jgi:hypothetical protein